MYNLFKLGKYLDPIAIKNQLLFKFDQVYAGSSLMLTKFVFKKMNTSIMQVNRIAYYNTLLCY